MSEQWMHFREWLADVLTRLVCVLLAVGEPQAAQCCACLEPIADPGDAVLRCKECDAAQARKVGRCD